MKTISSLGKPKGYYLNLFYIRLQKKHTKGPPNVWLLVKTDNATIGI